MLKIKNITKNNRGNYYFKVNKKRNSNKNINKTNNQLKCQKTINLIKIYKFSNNCTKEINYWI